MKNNLFLTELRCEENIFKCIANKKLATKYLLYLRLHPQYDIEPINAKSTIKCQKQIDTAMYDIKKYADKRLKKLEKEIGK